ncbi:branched-chain amino acid transport system substrate-binding protein [Mycobacterium frederiksbergense]|uniref:Branched-chain amino acid transport system substrate-binding protein n=1 Tax=Mycolicibacterium frederiksbergense TaxID=117567 RepID=A0ABT6KSQ4_9MYCO|nr:ABC transporter substrate-binding protein [Mycolicibacterium frederiksbergense]MDH6193762.1 branched-chain amino acid transport system substrate-binding protein [Mycolicibacterium frederiksbergense]
MPSASGRKTFTEFDGEFVASPAGKLISGTAPAALLRLSQAFLLTKREMVRFILRHENTDLNVVMTREGGVHHDAAVTACTFAAAALPAGMTSRELEVSTLVTLGLTNRQIAARLGTSPRTVSTQLERLLVKLGIESRSALAALCMDVGLFQLPVPGGVDDVPALTHTSMQRFAESLNHRPDRPLLPVTAANRRPILVGTLAPLDSLTGDDGMELVRGAALAIDDINDKTRVGGRKLVHVVEGFDMFDTDSAEQAMRRLIDAGVDAITTSYVTGEQPSILELAADYAHPFLHTATFDRQVRQLAQDQARYAAVFQTCPSERFYGRAFIRLLESLHTSGLWAPARRRLGVVELNSNSTRLADPEFAADLEQIGWQLGAVEQVAVAGQDWRSVAKRIAAKRISAVFVVDFIPDHVARLVIEIRRAGFDGLFHCVYGASVPRFVTTAGEAAEGVTWSSVTSRNLDDLGVDFSRKYTLRFGDEPGLSQASAAYDQVRLLATAWESVGADADRVTRFLRGTAYRGLNGIYYFGDTGHSVRSFPDETDDPLLGQALYTYQIQHGRSVRVASYSGAPLVGLRPPA